MPTYGEKWRDVSSACETGHVPRSYSATFLRLDSTGEVTSVDKNPKPNRTLFSSKPPREVNGNMINMKNWVASSVLSFNGLRTANNFTNTKSNTIIDHNDYIMDRIVPATAVNPINSNMPKCPGGFLPSQGMIPGWNINRHGFGMRNGRIPVFPCHQHPHSYGTPLFPHQGKMDMFVSPDYLTSMGKWTQPQMMDDHQWHQRHRKYDRSYRGHAPKHHKHDYMKSEKKTFPSEDMPSKRQLDRKSSQGKCANETPSVGSNRRTEPKCPDTTPKVDSSIRCNIQVKPEVVQSSPVLDVCDKDNSSEPKCPESGPNALLILNQNSKEGKSTKQKKSTNSCKMTQGFENTVTVNVTKSAESSDSDGRDSTCNKKSDAQSQNDNFQVLFVRKNWKKGRPSSSKRRRRMLQKAKSTCTESSADNSVGNEKLGCDAQENACPKNGEVRSNGTMSFIFGVNQVSPDNPNCSSASSSFVFSISDDEDNDDDDDFFSDCDSGTEWQADIADFAQCDLFNFLPQNKCASQTPINFQVHISPVQSDNDIQSKSMEDINSSWNVQISVLDDHEKKHEEKCKSKKKTKKVHFPQDKELSTVYPMVTWSYAYQEARKGHWENFVRDRDRFRRRVEDLEGVLNPVLASKHRDRIYEGRFQEL